MEIFQFDFMIRAFIAGIAVGIIAPLIGIFLVVRRYSLMADTLAHVSLLGVAAAFVAQINPLLSALVFATAAAIGMEKLRTWRKLPGDAILAIFLSGSLALAVVLISISRGFNASLFGFLFGSIATVQPSDLYFIWGLAAAVFAALALFYRKLFLVSFDEELAKARGIEAAKLNIALVVMAAVGVSLSIKVVGALLIGALMVIPVMAAIQFKQSFRVTMALAVLFSLFSVVSGLFLSYYLGWVSGGTIVIIALAIFLLSLFWKKQTVFEAANPS